VYLMGFYRCYCLLFLACRVFALSWVISVQQFTKFLRFRNSSVIIIINTATALP